MTISLLTNGWICYRTITIIRKYILPLSLQIRKQEILDLEIANKTNLNINLENIVDKNLNLTLTDKNINIKKTNSLDINIDK